jgi:hypothetical protein
MLAALAVHIADALEHACNNAGFSFANFGRMAALEPE